MVRMRNGGRGGVKNRESRQCRYREAQRVIGKRLIDGLLSSVCGWSLSRRVCGVEKTCLSVRVCMGVVVWCVGWCQSSILHPSLGNYLALRYLKGRGWRCAIGSAGEKKKRWNVTVKTLPCSTPGWEGSVWNGGQLPRCIAGATGTGQDIRRWQLCRCRCRWMRMEMSLASARASSVGEAEEKRGQRPGGAKTCACAAV